MLVSPETLHLEYRDGKTIAVITLDDPAHANAMSPETGDAFSRAVRDIQSESDIRAVLIRGAGKDFSVGGHRDMLTRLGNGSMTEQQLHDFMLAFYDLWLPMLDLEVPVISALQGDCIGVAPPTRPGLADSAPPGQHLEGSAALAVRPYWLAGGPESAGCDGSRPGAALKDLLRVLGRCGDVYENTIRSLAEFRN
jgi:hypothetical protein